ncbi:MAG: flagellar export chaperone FliS [Oscillospiraceae bacterium]|jgi:flagellar protein FliS|nr:flagellar export chaperone FliS [Oscillospiraceae bacterium]
MMMKNPQETYLKQTILTASPMELIVMLYDALRKNLLLAQRNIHKKAPAEAHLNLIKAQEIVTELMRSLDMSFEISANLMNLYEFMIEHLAEANMKKDADLVAEVADLVTELRDAWKQVCETQKTQLVYEGVIS